MQRITTKDAAEIFFLRAFGKRPSNDPSYFSDWVRRFGNGEELVFAVGEVTEVIEQMKLEYEW